MAMATVVERKPDEYKSEVKVTWCPGCGDFGVLNATYKALAEQGYDTKDVVVVSGIGCSSRFPFFLSTYGFHGVHGRAMPIATGIKLARPELEVIVFGGDGDAFAIGAGHFVHAMRRNLDITYVVMDNAIYGLTKGQTSPTSGPGFSTLSTPQGNPEQAMNPMMMAIASGATFVGRGFSAEPQKLADLIVEGINHKGFSFIDVYSPCPTFNKVNTFKAYREETADLPAGHDPSDKEAAMRIAASEDPLYLGVIYRAPESTSFEEHLQAQQIGTEADAPKVIRDIFRRFS